MTKTKRLFRSYRVHRTLLLMLIPGIAYYIIFHYIPMYGVQIAFKEFNFSKGITGSEWVGFAHFKDLLTLGSFKEVFGNTIVISFLKLIFGFPAPIIFALLLNELRAKRFKKAVQTISYLPHFVSWVILGGLFLQFLSPTAGPVNILIKAFGGTPISFLNDSAWFRGTLVVTSIWKGIGWGSIVYLASITGVNPELYESATIDGCNRFQLARHITIQSSIPVIMIMFIFSVGGIVNDDFDQIFNLYSPAVYSTGDVLSTYVYRKGVVELAYSFAAAVGVFKNIISVTLILITNKIASKFGEYGIW